MLASVRPARLSLVMLCAILFAACAPEKLVGTDLGTQQAPDFVLTDGLTGSTVRLSSLRPRVVALTFLYTQCPDTCPLTAEHFRQTQEKLGGASSQVTFVAVSVDPEHDTPAAVREFSTAHRLQRDWHFLIGSAAALRGVWQAYGIRQESDPVHGVGHTDAIYLIDAKGNARVLLHTEDGPDALTKDLRILAGER